MWAVLRDRRLRAPVRTAHTAWRWWHKPFNPSTWEAEVGDLYEFEVSLVYILVKLGNTTWRYPVSMKAIRQTDRQTES